MKLHSQIVNSIEIARMFRRRERRALKAQTTNRLLLAVPIVLGCVVVVGRLPVPGYELLWPTPGAYAYGTQPGAPVPAAVTAATNATTVLWLSAVSLVVVRESRAGDTVDAGLEVYRTIVTPGTLAGGRFCRYIGFTVRFVGPAILAGALAYGLAAESLAAVGSILLFGGALLTTAVGVALTTTATFRIAAGRFPVVGRNARTLAAVCLAGLGGALAVSRTSVGPSVGLPLDWLGRAALNASLVDIALVVPAAGLTTTAAIVATRREISVTTPEHPTRSTNRKTVTSRDETRTAQLLANVVPRPVAGVTVTTWRRVARRPSTAVYAVVMAPFSLVAVVLTVDQFALSPALATAVYGAPLAGVVAASNPLGSEGANLPATLTAPGGASTLVWGYIVATAVPGVIVVTTLTAGVGLLTGDLPVLVTGLAAGLSVAAVSAAAAVGVRYPQYDGVDIVSSRGVQSPRPETLGLLFVGIPAIGFPAVLVGGVTGTSPVGVVISLSAAAGVTALSLRTAIRTIGSIEL